MFPEIKTVLQNAVLCAQQSKTFGGALFLQSDHEHAALLGRNHSGGLYKLQSRFHRHKQTFFHGVHTAREDEDTPSFFCCCAPCTLSFFFRVIPSCFRLYQIQPRDTPKCRAISSCVISPCASTWRRNSSGFKLRGLFGPGFLYSRPSSALVQL